MRSFALLCVARAAMTVQSAASVVLAACNSTIYCQGQFLADIQLARPFTDSKTFVDKPTIKPVAQVLAAYEKLEKPLKNDSRLHAFLEDNFGDVGREIQPIESALRANPTFLEKVGSPIIKDFTDQVIGIWPSLTREPSTTRLCDGCDSSFLPIRHRCVVAGGRFTEVYYWDSFFILEGLLRSAGNYTALAKSSILNFLDFVETYGFVPNGGRKYYLNRSQPPLLSHMLDIYVNHTRDESILERAVPLLLKEQEFFEKSAVRLDVHDHGDAGLSVGMDQGTVLYRYTVDNNQPRPESFVEDYQTANNVSYYTKSGSIVPSPKLSEGEKELLYRNLASGAESGWDYSSRWLRDPIPAVTDSGIPLRSLNVVNTIPLDLQTIQARNAHLIASFYEKLGDDKGAKKWFAIAEKRRETVHRYHYNATLNAYFDYNLTSGYQNTHVPINSDGKITHSQFFSPIQYLPLALDVAVPEVTKNKTLVLDMYKPVERQLFTYPGGIAATNLTTGQQWDFPNVWPPLQYFLIKSLLNNSPGASSSSHGNHGESNDVDYKLRGIAREVGQRYLDALYCTWRSTGGAHPKLHIPPIRSGLGNGTIFEKYSALKIDRVGGGGEYAVVPGFGWTNGVLMWLVDELAGDLKTPKCPDVAGTSGDASDEAGVTAQDGVGRQVILKTEAA